MVEVDTDPVIIQKKMQLAKECIDTLTSLLKHQVVRFNAGPALSKQPITVSMLKATLAFTVGKISLCLDKFNTETAVGQALQKFYT